MKTIFLVIGGLADIPDKTTDGKTPLQLADSPSLDTLAECGCCGLIKSVPDNVAPTTENAILSLLGYDFSRGRTSLTTLEACGRGNPFLQSDMRFFVIPKFSGHGVVISDNAVVRGIGMSAILRPLFTIDASEISSSSHPCGSLSDKAIAAIRAIESFDFVLVYVDDAEIMSLKGDLQGKIDAIGKIDNELVRPIADYVWNAKLQMNLVVTSDHVASWRNRRAIHGDVPAVVYFNDDLPYDTKRFDEEAVKDGPLNAPLPGDLIRKLISFEPYAGDEKE